MKIRITPSYVYLALSLSQMIAAGPVGSQQREDDYVPRGLDDVEQEEVLAQRLRDEEGLKLRDGDEDAKISGKAFGLETGKRVEGELISLNSSVKRGKNLLEMFDEVDEEEAKAKGLAKAVNAVMGPGSSSGSSDKAKGTTRWPSWDRVKAYVAHTKAAGKGKEAERAKPKSPERSKAKSPEQPRPNPTPSGPRVSFRAERYGGHGHPWRLSQLPPGTRTRGRGPPHWTYPPTRTPRPAPRPTSSVRIEELPPSPPRRPASPPPAAKRPKKDASGSGESRRRDLVSFKQTTSEQSEEACEPFRNNEQRGYDDLMEAFYKQYVDRKSEQPGDSTLPVPPASASGVASSGPISTSPGRSRRRPKFKKLVDVLAAANKFKVERGLGRTSQASSSSSNWKKLPFKKRPVSPDPLKTLPIKKRPAKINLFEDLPMKKRPRPNNHSGSARETPQAAPKRWRATPKPRSCIEVDESPLADLQSDNEKRGLGDIAEALDKVDDVVDNIKAKTTSGAGPSLSSAKDKAKGKSRWSSLRRIKDYVGKSKSKVDSSLLTSPKRHKPAAVPVKKYETPGPHRAHGPPTTAAAGFINRKYPKATKAAPPATQLASSIHRKYPGPTKARPAGTGIDGPRDRQYPKATKAHPPTTATQANGLRDRKYPGPTRARPPRNGIDGPRGPKHLKGPSRLGRRFAFSNDSKRGLGDTVEALDKVGLSEERCAQRLPTCGLPETGDDSEITLSNPSNHRPSGGNKRGMAELIGSLHRVENFGAITKAADQLDDVDDAADVVAALHKAESSGQKLEEASSNIKRMGRKIKTSGRSFGGTADIIAALHNRESSVAHKARAKGTDDQKSSSKKAAAVGKKAEGATKKSKERIRTESAGKKAQNVGKKPEEVGKKTKASFRKFKSAVKSPRLPEPTTNGRSKDSSAHQAKPAASSAPPPTVHAPSTPPRPSKRPRPQEVGPAPIPPAEKPTVDKRGFADVVASLHEVENAGSKVAEVGDKARNMADAVGLLHKAEADSELHKAAENDGKKSTAKRVHTFKSLVSSGLPKRPDIVGSNSAGSVDMIQKIYGGAKPQEKPWPTPKMAPQRLVNSAGWRAWPGPLHAQPGGAAPSGFLGHSLRPKPRPSVRRPRRPEAPKRPEAPRRPGVKRPGRTQRPQRPERRPKRPKTEGDSGGSSSTPPRKRPLGNERRGMGDLVAGLHEIEAASESIKDVAEKLESAAASPDKVEHAAKDAVKKVQPVTSAAPSGSQRPFRSQRGRRISSDSQRPLDEIRKIFGGERVKNQPKPAEKPGPPSKVSSKPGNSFKFGKYLGVKHAGPMGPRRPGYLQRPQRAQRPGRPLSIQRPKPEAYSGVESPLSPKPRSLDNEKRGMGDLISSLHDFENAKKKSKLENKTEGNADVIPALHEAESSQRLEEVVKKKLKKPIHSSFGETDQISTGDSAFTSPVPPSKLGGPSGPSGKKSMIHKAIDIYAKGKAKDPKSVGIPYSRGWTKSPETGNEWVRPQRGSPDRTRPAARRPFSEGRKTGAKRKSHDRRFLADHEERGMAEVIAAIHEAESQKAGHAGKNPDSSGDKTTGVGRRIKEAASARFERLKGAVKSETSQSARAQSLIRTKWPGGWHELHVQQRPPSPPRPLKRPKSEDGSPGRRSFIDDRGMGDVVASLHDLESAGGKIKKVGDKGPIADVIAALHKAESNKKGVAAVKKVKEEAKSASNRSPTAGSSGPSFRKHPHPKGPISGIWERYPFSNVWRKVPDGQRPKPSPYGPFKRRDDTLPDSRRIADEGPFDHDDEKRGMAEIVASLHQVESSGKKVQKVGDKAKGAARIIDALHDAESGHGQKVVEKAKQRTTKVRHPSFTYFYPIGGDKEKSAFKNPPSPSSLGRPGMSSGRKPMVHKALDIIAQTKSKEPELSGKMK